jgi:hypothetical protein
MEEKLSTSLYDPQAVHVSQACEETVFGEIQLNILIGQTTLLTLASLTRRQSFAKWISS